MEASLVWRLRWFTPHTTSEGRLPVHGWGADKVPGRHQVPVGRSGAAAEGVLIISARAAASAGRWLKQVWTCPPAAGQFASLSPLPMWDAFSIHAGCEIDVPYSRKNNGIFLSI
jgi:hypothetical protein